MSKKKIKLVSKIGLGHIVIATFLCAGFSIDTLDYYVQGMRLKV